MGENTNWGIENTNFEYKYFNSPIDRLVELEGVYIYMCMYINEYVCMYVYLCIYYL
jgi:hypothetical protein